jgi:hypothetical protein
VCSHVRSHECEEEGRGYLIAANNSTLSLISSICETMSVHHMAGKFYLEYVFASVCDG